MQRWIFITLLALMALATNATYAASPPPQLTPGQGFLRALDADGDRVVSEDEFIKPRLQMLKNQFAHMDKNKDTYVDEDEANDFAKEMQEFIRKKQQEQKQQNKPN